MPDTQAVMTDDLPPEPHVLTALMQENIPKSLRNFILAPNGIIKPYRLPLVTYKRHNIHPFMPDLHTEACLQNSCWGSHQEQLSSKPELQHLFLNACSTAKDIMFANDVLIPLDVGLSTPLYTYGRLHMMRSQLSLNPPLIAHQMH